MEWVSLWSGAGSPARTEVFALDLGGGNCVLWVRTLRADSLGPTSHMVFAPNCEVQESEGSHSLARVEVQMPNPLSVSL